MFIPVPFPCWLCSSDLPLWNHFPSPCSSIVHALSPAYRFPLWASLSSPLVRFLLLLILLWPSSAFELDMGSVVIRSTCDPTGVSLALLEGGGWLFYVQVPKIPVAEEGFSSGPSGLWALSSAGGVRYLGITLACGSSERQRSGGWARLILAAEFKCSYGACVKWNGF